MGETSPPPAAGIRPDWSAMPGALTAELETWLGSPIAQVIGQVGGFSPGVAARIRTEDGRRFFVKAGGPIPNPGVPDIYRQEARVVTRLPEAAPVPRLLWSHDQGAGGWIMLVYEEIDGSNPTLPWRREELDRAVDAIAALNDLLTPSPLPAGMASTAREVFDGDFGGWHLLQDEDPSRIHLLDDWSRRNLDALAAIEATSPEAVEGDTLLHFDIRADNMLVTPERIWFVDWPLATVGAAWVDVIFFAPSVTMQGGPPPEEVIARHPAIRRADPDKVTAAIVATAGFFTHRAVQPPPPGLPTVRAFQAAQGVVAREWVALRTGLK
jgi:aminoglycoside phosphotransferase (APT) family kinase protein